MQNFPFDLVPKGQGGDGDGSGGGGGGDDAPTPKQEVLRLGLLHLAVDGYIVTNNHVIDGAEDIKVVTKDGTELRGDPRWPRRGDGPGGDQGRHGHNFPSVAFETSVQPRVGDWVVAVGNPFDLNGTATAGIISAYNRDIGESAFDDYIQIDAPINRGNSGGPTFDVYGRVIGVNSAIYSPTGGSVGIGFAIPADVADSITRKLMAGQAITRGYIGATIQNLSPELAQSWGLSNSHGAQVTDLVPGGPAEHAGLQAGDVVVAVNGVPVKSNSEMTREVAKAQAGDTIHLDVFRGGKERTVDIKSGTRPSEAQLALNGGAPDSDDQGQGGPGKQVAPAGAPVLGMQLAPLNAMTRGQFNIPDAVKAGVVVAGVKGSSDAGDKGLQRGDVIVQAGDHEIATAADLASAVAEWKREGRTAIPLGVRRGGQTTEFVPIKIDG